MDKEHVVLWSIVVILIGFMLGTLTEGCRHDFVMQQTIEAKTMPEPTSPGKFQFGDIVTYGDDKKLLKNYIVLSRGIWFKYPYQFLYIRHEGTPPCWGYWIMSEQLGDLQAQLWTKGSSHIQWGFVPEDDLRLVERPTTFKKQEIQNEHD